MPGSKSEKPSQNRPQQQAEGASRPSRSTATVPGGKPQSTRLKPPLKQSRGRSPSPASRRKDTTTEKKDSEVVHNSKGHNESSQKKEDKVDSTPKTRVIHHKTHEKHTEDDGSKFHDVSSKSHTSRHGKHNMDKSDKHKLTKPESSVVRSRSKSPSRSKQTESVEVSEKANTKASMEHERCELIDDQTDSGDKEVPPEEERDSSEHFTGDKPVDRISYTKKELMALKSCERAQQRPAELTDEILNLLSSDANRPKYPATLSLRKEGNESRAFPDISLSPQRGSFSSGCKYKSNRESINKDGSGDAPATPLSSRIPEEGSKFSFHEDTSTQKEFSQYRTPHGPQSSSQFNWQRSQSSSTYRDYNGGSTCQDDDSNNRPSGRPSYSRYNQSYQQQESYRGNGNSRGYYQSESYSEPEPEWMQFGPSSRTEFMELGGEDEIEKMREEFKARQKKVDEAFNKNTILSQDNIETPSDVSDKDGELVSCISPDVNTTNDDELEHNNNVFNNDHCNDETISEQQAAGSGNDEGYKMADSNRPAEEQSLLLANSNDEFAVDLNRILNICDDMEDDDMIHQQQTNIHSEGSQLSKLFGAHLPKHSGQEQLTSDPSNLLMQVLGVQRDGQVNSCHESSQKSLVVGNKPANALTLDEVLAKENISVSGDDQGDQSAFKKFLATIQQQQSPGDLPSSNSVMENNRHYNDATHLTNLFSGQERGAVRDPLEQYSFSIQHDHVGQPQYDDQSQPLPIGYNRYSRQMEQQQNIGLPHQFYMQDEERMSSKEMCNSEQQRMQQQQQSSLQPPVQRIDQKKLLEQHIQQDVQEHVRQHLEQQQRQRAAAQFRQQQQQIQQQQQQQARMKHQQHMMVMEQQKRVAALSGGTGGMMYSGSLPPPQSHKPPMANQPLGFMPTSVMKHNFKQTRTVPEINKPSTRLEQDLNQKAVSTHSSLTGLISHSMPEDDHQFLQQDQPRPHYGYSSLPRMSMPPHGGGPRYPLPHPHHHPAHHHMMGAPPPPGYAMMGPAHPHHMPPFPSKHNSLPQGYFNWN